jgi:hypothetical protein
MNLKISSNEDFICFHDFSERVKHNKDSFNELEIEIIESMSKIIGSSNIKNIFEDSKYLVSRYLNYLTKYYSIKDILSFMETREHWKLSPDSTSEAAAVIVDSCYSLMSSFTESINEPEKGFTFRPIMYIIGALNYYEEQISD